MAVYEWCFWASLLDVILNTGKFRIKYAKYFFKELISGVKYLHSQNVAHRDLKAENTLFSLEGVLKIADFGLSTTEETSIGTVGS